jgi:cellulose synthase/poly-beta-1,6-N-acetylglucosamine synthase-like glycosyltransferase
MLFKGLAGLALTAAGAARSANRITPRHRSGGILTRLRRVRQRPVSGVLAPLPDDEYAFLLKRHIDAATLRRAKALAQSWAVPVHEVLITQGWLTERAYVQALADELGLPAADGQRLKGATPGAPYPAWPKVMAGVTAGGREVVAVEARSFAPRVLRSIAVSGGRLGHRFMLATRHDITQASQRQWSPALIDAAIHGLWRAAPLYSARTPHPLWQGLLLASLLSLAVAGLAAVPDLAGPVLAVMFAVPFLCVTALRIVAMLEVLRPKRRRQRVRATDPSRLPAYSVMVALYQEAEVLPGLVRALAALDYPAAKLQILLILETDDDETRRVADSLDLPGNFEIVVVPDRGPRTKPKALNYALGLARGDFVVIYDAEDLPEPDQIHRALALFQASGPDLACVQAQLDIYNGDANWLTHQFALEYAALFSGTLPALERLGIPVPLGGTSNHFRIEVLRGIGAWDPYNVTEDADLGFRIARAGLRTATLDSRTWEEAPVQFGNWLRQRTRWLKGWMQTYLVHNRAPWRVLRELGFRRCIGLHVLMGSILLSALAHPWCYVLLIAEAMQGRLLAPAEGLGQWLWWIAVINLGAGYASAMGLGALVAIRRGRYRLASKVLFTPFYWLLISCAGYRALIQLVREPYRWEKTQHGMGGDRRPVTVRRPAARHVRRRPA